MKKIAQEAGRAKIKDKGTEADVGRSTGLMEYVRATWRQLRKRTVRPVYGGFEVFEGVPPTVGEGFWMCKGNHGECCEYERRTAMAAQGQSVASWYYGGREGVGKPTWYQVHKWSRRYGQGGDRVAGRWSQDCLWPEDAALIAIGCR